MNNETIKIKSSYVQNENIEYVKRFSPAFLSKNETMQNIYDVEMEEMKKFNDEISLNFQNTYVESLNLYGIRKWEKLLKLESNKNLDLNARKKILNLKRYFNPPFTRQNLYLILNSIWGYGNYSFDIYPINETTQERDYFSLIININSDYPEVYLKFQQFIRELIPANIYVIFSIQYTYLYLNQNLNYNNMSVMTYAELSKYSNTEVL